MKLTIANHCSRRGHRSGSRTYRFKRDKTAVVSLKETLASEQQAVEAASKAVAAELTKTSQEVRTQLTSKVDSAANAFTAHLQEYDQKFAGTLEQETQRLLKAINADMEEYQAQRRELLDANIAQIVEQVAKQVLHKQLTVSEHTELAKQALASVKQREVM